MLDGFVKRSAFFAKGWTQMIMIVLYDITKGWFLSCWCSWASNGIKRFLFFTLRDLECLFFFFFLKRFFNSSCSFLWLWCHKNETSKNSLKGLVKNPPNVLFNINFEPNVESPAPSQSWRCSSPTGPKPVHHLIHSPSVFQLQQFHSGPHISGCYITFLFLFFFHGVVSK